jgi:hypothetical protein
LPQRPAFNRLHPTASRWIIWVMAGPLRTIAAVVAVTLFGFVVYQDQHRSYSTNTRLDLTSVLVAKRPIPKGTTGSAIFQRRLYTLAEVSRSQLRNGAIFSPTALAGRFELFAKKVARADIRPGSVLSPADFGRSPR